MPRRHRDRFWKGPNLPTPDEIGECSPWCSGFSVRLVLQFPENLFEEFCELAVLLVQQSFHVLQHTDPWSVLTYGAQPVPDHLLLLPAKRRKGNLQYKFRISQPGAALSVRLLISFDSLQTAQ